MHTHTFSCFFFFLSRSDDQILYTLQIFLFSVLFGTNHHLWSKGFREICRILERRNCLDHFEHRILVIDHNSRAFSIKKVLLVWFGFAIRFEEVKLIGLDTTRSILETHFKGSGTPTKAPRLIRSWHNLFYNRFCSKAGA